MAEARCARIGLEAGRAAAVGIHPTPNRAELSSSWENALREKVGLLREYDIRAAGSTTSAVNLSRRLENPAVGDEAILEGTAPRRNGERPHEDLEITEDRRQPPGGRPLRQYGAYAEKRSPSIWTITGYSSMQNLICRPSKLVKIDRPLVWHG